MTDPTEARILWRPDAARVAATQMEAFRAAVNEATGRDLPDSAALQAWSVTDPETFWRLVWARTGVIGEGPGPVYQANPGSMPGAGFFPDARVNFAENLLRTPDERPACIYLAEPETRDGAAATERSLTRRQLAALTGRIARAMAAAGVGVGDRVAGFVGNTPETLACMLAAVSLGAIWSSASPDFGVQGVLDRFGQIAPKLLVAHDGYRYGGKKLDNLPKLREILPQLPSLSATVILPYLTDAPDLAGLSGAVTLADFLASHADGPPSFTRVPFDHPLFIMFSSGTTGVPKCIVHGHGGTILQHLKEHRLHCDVRDGDRVFYFTTCGWMMWNWLVSALAAEATLLLYDGSPFHPDGNVLFDFAARHRCTLFGTSAKFIDALKKGNYRPRDTHDLSSVRTITSTGSPLVAESFDYVYESIHPDVHLASISGGTDIVSCFVLGDPTGPVRRGEIQMAGLGMDVGVADEDGHPLTEGRGELICKTPFPSMPVAFWNDPDGAKYRAAYFDRFPGYWHHGDFIERTHAGGWIIHGRSDATLNPGGVRIGTAEIYRQVEQIDAIVESLCVAQDWQDDVRVVLFVVLRPGATLDAGLEADIRKRIREGASPRHVPARIVAVTDLPRTKSGKITELAVREVIHGRPVKNVEALANPLALEQFRDLAQLKA